MIQSPRYPRDGLGLALLAGAALMFGCAQAEKPRRLEVEVYEIRAVNGACPTRWKVNGLDCRFMDRSKPGMCLYSCLRDIKSGKSSSETSR